MGGWMYQVSTRNPNKEVSRPDKKRRKEGRKTEKTAQLACVIHPESSSVGLELDSLNALVHMHNKRET